MQETQDPLRFRIRRLAWGRRRVLSQLKAFLRGALSLAALHRLFLCGPLFCERLHEALGALELELDEDEVAAIERAVPPEAVAGERYPEQGMATLDSERSS